MDERSTKCIARSETVIFSRFEELRGQAPAKACFFSVSRGLSPLFVLVELCDALVEVKQSVGIGVVKRKE